MSKNKKIYAGQKIQKKIVTGELPDYGNVYPSWRFSLADIQEDSPWKWPSPNDPRFNEIYVKLLSFEKMTISQLFGGHNNHRVSVDKICSDAQKRLKQINLNDYEELVSIRLNGAQRIWGVEERGIISVIWDDKFHQVYPSKKFKT